MRIISDFRDYYDGLQDGSDPRVWNRKQEILGSIDRNRYQKIYYALDCIGFCGELYPCISVIKNSLSNPAGIYYDLESFRKDYPRQEKKHNYWRPWNIDEAFTYFQMDRVYCKKYFEEFQTPLFYMHDFNLYRRKIEQEKTRYMVLNPQLQFYKFYRMKDMYSTIQELEMYIFDVLQLHSRGKTKYQGKTMDSTVSDKDLTAAKGFDKYSFRKEKSK